MDVSIQAVAPASTGGWSVAGEAADRVERVVVETSQRAVLGDRVDEFVQHAAGVGLREVRLDPVNVPGTSHEHANWQRKVTADVAVALGDEGTLRLFTDVQRARS